MPITVECKCGKKFKTKDENAGKKSRCAACGEILLIPVPAAAIAGVAAANVAPVAKVTTAPKAAAAPSRAAAAAPPTAKMSRPAPTPDNDIFDIIGMDEPAPKKKPAAVAPQPDGESNAPATPAPSKQTTLPAAMMFPTAPKPPKFEKRGIHIGGGLMTFTIAALFLVGTTIFIVREGPVKTQAEWKEMGPRCEGDVETVISFAMRGYFQTKGYTSGTFKRMPQAENAFFDEPILMFRIPEAMSVQGDTTHGRYHGKFHPRTGELEAEITLDLEGVTIHITGRVSKTGQTTAEMNGVPLKDLGAAGYSGPGR